MQCKEKKTLTGRTDPFLLGAGAPVDPGVRHEQRQRRLQPQGLHGGH